MSNPTTLDQATFRANAVAPSAGAYTLAVNVAPPGAGTVGLDPGMPAQGYAAGTQVTLTALPSQGYAFSGWSGDLTGQANPAAVTMDGDKTVTASFATSGGGAGDLLTQLVPLMLVVMMMGMIDPLTEGMS